MPNIKLQSSDREIFEVDEQVVNCSGTIKTMLEVCRMEEGNNVVPLENVNSTILRKVLHWAEYHKNDPLASEEDRDKLIEHIPAWDADFLRVDQSTLFQIISASNYLGIKELQNMSCKTIADMIKGKSPEEVRILLNIKDQYKPRESSVAAEAKESH